MVTDRCLLSVTFVHVRRSGHGPQTGPAQTVASRAPHAHPRPTASGAHVVLPWGRRLRMSQRVWDLGPGSEGALGGVRRLVAHGACLPAVDAPRRDAPTAERAPPHARPRCSRRGGAKGGQRSTTGASRRAPHGRGGRVGLFSLAGAGPALGALRTASAPARGGHPRAWVGHARPHEGRPPRSLGARSRAGPPEARALPHARAAAGIGALGEDVGGLSPASRARAHGLGRRGSQAPARGAAPARRPGPQPRGRGLAPRAKRGKATAGRRAPPAPVA
jgi:hypothetical protein